MIKHLQKLKAIIAQKHRKGHRIHSPYIFSLVTHVIHSKGDYIAYSKLENQHKQLKKLYKTIYCSDQYKWGKFQNKNIVFRELYSYVSISTKNQKLLYRLINEFHSLKETILYIGNPIGYVTSFIKHIDNSAIIHLFYDTIKTDEMQIPQENVSCKNNLGEEELIIIDKLFVLDIDLLDKFQKHITNSTKSQYIIILKNEYTQIFWEICKSSERSVTLETPSIGIAIFNTNLHSKHYSLRF